VTVARARTVARGYVPGAVGEAARLRRQLERSRDAVRGGLGVARVTAAPVGDVPSLLRRIDAAAVSVDAELRMVEAMRDRPRVSEALSGPRSRALALIAAADDLAAGLLAASSAGAGDMSLLQAECAIEAEALRAAGGHLREAGLPADPTDPAPAQNRIKR
jgi:hypothetical protein